MGNSQSSNITQTLSVANTAITNVVSNTSQTNTNQVINSNTFTLNIDPNAKFADDVNINLGQKIKSEQKPTVSASVTNSSELKTQLTSALQASTESLSKSAMGALAIGMNVQNSSQDINQAISNLVENNITNNTTTVIQNFLNNANNGTLNIAGDFKKKFNLNNPQEIITSQIVNTIMGSITESAAATEVGNKMAAASKSTLDSKMEGIVGALAKLVGSAGLAVALIMMAPCIGIAICIFACCAGKGHSGGGSSSPSPAAAFGKKLKTTLKKLKKIS